MGFCGIAQKAVTVNFKDYTNHNICPVIYNAAFKDDIIARKPFGACSRERGKNAQAYIYMVMGFRQTQAQRYVAIIVLN